MLIFLIFLQFVSLIHSLTEYPELTYYKLYEEGVKAYLNKEWPRCISLFLRAIEDHKFFQKTMLKCYKQCSTNFNSESIDEIDYFTFNINMTLCLIKCRNNVFSYRPLQLRNQVDDLMDDYMPYNYLQYCFFQIRDYPNAISYAYTYYLYNPQEEDMKNNLLLYNNFSTSPNDYKNLELDYHHEFYLNGVNSYLKEQWYEAIDYFEEAIVQYYIKNKECHLLCQGPYRYIFNYDFISTISNIYALRIKCNRGCIRKLNTLPGEFYDETIGAKPKNLKGDISEAGHDAPLSSSATKFAFLDDYLSSHYHYLQYAYYQIGDLKSAAKNVATYLIFDPFSEDMANNRKFYTRVGHLESSDFVPRKEAIDYHNRHYRESQLLEFIELNFHAANIPKPSKDAPLFSKTNETDSPEEESHRNDNDAELLERMIENDILATTKPNNQIPLMCNLTQSKKCPAHKSTNITFARDSMAHEAF